MGVIINTNISANVVQRNMTYATERIGKSIEKLSTGYRINRASDDAAGLTISEGLRAQSQGSKVAMSNAQTGINMLQTAEGDLTIIQENLQRIRDLAVQAANGTYGSSERDAIKAEVGQRLKEITRLADSSAFNKLKLLDGNLSSLSLQIGPNYVANAISLNALDVSSPFKAANAIDLGIYSKEDASYLDNRFASTSSAASYISNIDVAINDIATRRSTIGAYQNRLESSVRSLQVKVENLVASDSRIRDVDVAVEAAELTRNQILQQASTSLLAQANQAPSVALTLI